MADNRKQTEREFLAAQAAFAQTQIKGAACRLERHLREAADPVAWIKAHPIATTAAAMVGGFAATAATSCNGHKTEHQTNEDAQGEPEKPAESEPRKPSHSLKEELLGKLTHEIIGLVRPILTGIMSAYFASNRPAPEPHQTEPRES